MEGIWGHEQGVNNTFYGFPDGERALLITAPLSQRDSKWPDTFINSLFRRLHSPPVLASCIPSELAGENVDIYITIPFRAPQASVCLPTKVPLPKKLGRKRDRGSHASSPRLVSGTEFFQAVSIPNSECACLDSRGGIV